MLQYIAGMRYQGRKGIKVRMLSNVLTMLSTPSPSQETHKR